MAFNSWLSPLTVVAIGLDANDSHEGVLRIWERRGGLQLFSIELTISERVAFAGEAMREGWSLGVSPFDGV